MKLGLLISVMTALGFALPPLALAKSSKIQNQGHKKAQKEAESLDSNSDATKQAQNELQEAEDALETIETPSVSKSSSSSFVAPATPVDKPQYLSKNKIDETGSEDSSRAIKSKDAVNQSQASKDYDNARQTLREVKKEWAAKKAHVKTKDELRREREEAQFRLAITKAYKEHATKGDKSQVVHTPKGNVKVVYINESEFSEQQRPEVISPQLREAIRDRGREPASVDDAIDSATAE